MLSVSFCFAMMADMKMKAAKAAFDTSVDRGITFIDTAEVYGSRVRSGCYFNLFSLYINGKFMDIIVHLAVLIWCHKFRNSSRKVYHCEWVTMSICYNITASLVFSLVYLSSELHWLLEDLSRTGK